MNAWSNMFEIVSRNIEAELYGEVRDTQSRHLPTTPKLGSNYTRRAYARRAVRSMRRIVAGVLVAWARWIRPRERDPRCASTAT